MIPSLPFHPNAILDVGANIGYWANEAAQKWPNAYLMLVEGNPECAQALANTGRSYRIALLSDEEKEVTFYTRKDSPGCTGASIYRENSQFYEGEKAIPQTATTDTLDHLFPDDVFDFIKIDVQGSELDILKGGKNLVSRARALLLEVATSDYNPGAPRKEEVVAYCLANGFKQAITVETIVHPVTRQPIQEDVLFLR